MFYVNLNFTLKVGQSKIQMNIILPKMSVSINWNGINLSWIIIR